MTSFACLRGALVASAIILLNVRPGFSQLEKACEAHGGLGTWQSFNAVEFDVDWVTPKGSLIDHELFDIKSRSGLIKSSRYTLGAVGNEVWISPEADALGGIPPRFYMWTPFYFFGMPFVLADPGTVHQSLGKKNFAGKEYDAVKVTFKAGTGDTPDDFYVAYVDPASGQLKLVYYIVTYPTMRKGRPIEELDQHAIVFEEWQSADGLIVPKRAELYNWENEEIKGESMGKLRFSGVHFSTARPDPKLFKKPADAVIAPMP